MSYIIFVDIYLCIFVGYRVELFVIWGGWDGGYGIKVDRLLLI